MAALPYIQLYVADYLADTMHLTTEQHGAYMLIIMNYWQTGKPVPESRLKHVAKLTNDRWPDVERTLKEFFRQGENGEWIHDRIDIDLAKVKGKVYKASKAGKASAAKRAEKTGLKVTDSKGVSNGRSNSVQHKSNHKDTDTDTDTDTDKTKGKKPFVFPDWINQKAWDEFEQHRRDIKKPLTDLARKKNLAIMEKHQDKQAMIINLTIANRWAGLFEPKGGQQGKRRTFDDHQAHLHKLATDDDNKGIE